MTENLTQKGPVNRIRDNFEKGGIPKMSRSTRDKERYDKKKTQKEKAEWMDKQIAELNNRTTTELGVSIHSILESYPIEVQEESTRRDKIELAEEQKEVIKNLSDSPADQYWLANIHKRPTSDIDDDQIFYTLGEN